MLTLITLESTDTMSGAHTGPTSAAHYCYGSEYICVSGNWSLLNLVMRK